MSAFFDDSNYMRRIAAQDQQAFRALYDQYGRAVYSLAYRVLQDATMAEEVTQDTFLKVWGQKTHWDATKGQLKSWLLTITHYTAIDRLRREHRQPDLHPDAIEEVELKGSIAPSGPNWQDDVALHTLIKALPADQASLVDLAFFQGLSHSDIAEVTHLPLGTVKTRLRAALQRLRELWLETSKP